MSNENPYQPSVNTAPVTVFSPDRLLRMVKTQQSAVAILWACVVLIIFSRSKYVSILGESPEDRSAAQFGIWFVLAIVTLAAAINLFQYGKAVFGSSFFGLGIALMAIIPVIALIAIFIIYNVRSITMPA